MKYAVGAVDRDGTETTQTATYRVSPDWHGPPMERRTKDGLKRQKADGRCIPDVVALHSLHRR